MNTTVLQKLSVDKLKELQQAVQDEINRRYDFSMVRGRTGTFVATTDGLKRHVTIERINPKTVSVVETGKSVNPGSRWKVTKRALSMDGVLLETTEMKITIAPSAPPSETYGVDTW